MNQMITKYQFFWDWKDEKQEAWLQEMSLKGLHFVSTNSFGFFRFEQGEPKHYAYRLDYRDSNKDQPAYVQIFTDAGWKHLDESFGWQYFRKESEPGKTPEIYTDAESKIHKYRRLETMLGSIGATMSMLFVVSWDPSFESAFELIMNLFIGLFYAAALVSFFISFSKIEGRIKQLKETPLQS